MSLTVFEEVKCPCGETFQSELVSSINAHQDPQLKELLLGGELNIIKCPECHQLFNVDHFLLYIDTQDELIAFVYPLKYEKDREQVEVKMKSDFVQAQDALFPGQKITYDPVLVFGLDSLVDLLRYESEKKDEAAVVEFVCKTNKIGCVALKPAQARERNLPPVLPALPVPKDHSKTSLGEIKAGFSKVLELSPGLVIYREVFKRIAKENKFDLSGIVR